MGRFRNFCQFLRVSVSVSENLVSEKSLGFGYGKFGFGNKVSVSVSENFGLGKKSSFRKIWSQKQSLGFGFGKLWSRKKVSVSENLVSETKSRFRFRKTLVSEKSLGFGKFGLGKEKIQITRTVLVMMSQIWDLVPIGTKALKWSHISPNSARKSQISSLWQDAKLPM